VVSSPASARAADGRAASAAAVVVALFAFALYRATLLPGVDFGDTGSFQTTIGSPFLTPRVGYPLYFAIADLFLYWTKGEPAHALNLVTALEGALACGLFVLVAAELSGSIAAAAAAGGLFAVSYTFWSQCVIGEVYALHIALTLASLGLLLRWERRPSTARLAAFFLIFAIGFGNHLSMALLLPGFAMFLLWSSPGGWRAMVAPRTIALATLCASIGAAQYLWNLRTLWRFPDPPASIIAGLKTFWFDVTKSDWRDTMVLEVPQSLLRDHAAMYWFDLRQQFGTLIPIVAVAGLIALARTQPRRAALLSALYLATFAFAFSYNVGDSHVFYLSSHLVVALLAACGAAACGRIDRRGAAVATLALAVYAAIRGYEDYPALDRSRDTRPLDLLRSLTDGLDDRRAIFVVDLNWQIANGLSYFTKSVRPEVAVARVRDVLLYAPALIADNAAIGREVAATPAARRILHDSYGPLLTAVPGVQPPQFADVVGTVPAGTRYVVCVLRPSRDLAIDRADLDRALRVLAGGAAGDLPTADYVLIAGVAGRSPAVVEASARPFRRTLDLDGVDAEVRFESWLTSDTIRRMGFGHVIVNRRHTLIVERGISFATFAASGDAQSTAYFSNIFARQGRYLIR
jgi:hypothetical protein